MYRKITFCKLVVYYLGGCFRLLTFQCKQTSWKFWASRQPCAYIPRTTLPAVLCDSYHASRLILLCLLAQQWWVKNECESFVTATLPRIFQTVSLWLCPWSSEDALLLSCVIVWVINCAGQLPLATVNSRAIYSYRHCSFDFDSTQRLTFSR